MLPQLRNVVLAMVGLLFSYSVLRPCHGQIALTVPSELGAARPAAIRAAAATLKKRQAADWLKVSAADQAEAAALNAATTAAMKAGDANAVVEAQRLLKVVKSRLAQEKAEPPFPMFFQPAAFTANLRPSVSQLETARNRAVAAAVAQSHLAQAAFHQAVIAADGQEVARLEARVKAAMKAGHASAVVAAMTRLKQARQQLRQDSPVPSGRPPFGGGRGGGTGNPGNGGGGGTGSGNAGTGGGASIPPSQSHGEGNAAPRRDWPRMVKEANEPLATGSICAVGAAIPAGRNSHRLVGGRVTWHIGTGLGLALSGRQRLEWRRLRLEIRRHFRAIRQAAARRDAAEYRYQLGLLQAANPNATMWQVAWPIKHAEQIERTKVARLAKKDEHADIRLLAESFRVARLHMRVLGLKGVSVPTSGPIYGVILAARSVVSHPQTPAFSLPSGISLRISALGPMAALQYVPFSEPGSFLGNVPALVIPAMPVGAERVEHITILYCGRYPHYQGAGGGAKPAHGYVFIMKGGTTLRASSYTTGQSYYHALWDGVNFLIARDLVVKIRPK